MFPDRVKALRKSVKLTQREFGERLGVSIDVVKNLEYNRVEPTDLIINVICAKFGVNEHWLRTGEGEMFEEPQDDIDRICEAYGFGDIARAAMHEFVRLTPEHQQLITDYVRATVERYLRDAAPAASGPPDDPDLTPEVLAELDRADALLSAQQDEPPARDA